MSLTPLNDNLNIVQALSDRPNALEGLNAAQLKAKFDEAPNIIKDYINNVLIPELTIITDGDSGADNIGISAIDDLDGTTIQLVLESLRNKLKATTDGASGADFVSATEISGLTGGSIQEILEALKALIDSIGSGSTAALNDHKISGDHDGRYYTETEIDTNFVSKSNLENTRMLSPTGDFTGSWFGVTNPAQSDPGIAGLVELHTEQLADITPDVIPGKRGDLSAVLRKDGTKVVFTGDSMSFNRYDFSASVGTNDAYSYYPGMLSWSFMFRDAIHANDDCFKTFDELLVTRSGATLEYNNLAAYAYAFNGRVMRVVSTSSTHYVEFDFQTNLTSNKIVLYLFTYSNNSEACTFDVQVNGVTRASGSNYTADTTTWRGFAPVEVTISTGFTPGQKVKIRITNLIPQSGGTARLFLYGVGTVKREVYFTGHGGWKTSDLLTNVDDRILQYAPDVLFIAIGSNDTFFEVPVDTYKSNIESIITQSRAENANCEIVLLTSSYMNANQSGTVNASYYDDYNKALGKLATTYNCYYVDMIRFFENFDVSLWRYDNVHLNKFGNTMFGRHIINKLMPQGNYNTKYINAELTYVGQLRSEPLPRVVSYHGLQIATWGGSSFSLSNTYSVQDNVVSVLEKNPTNSSEIILTLNIDDNYLGRFPHITQFVAKTVKQAFPLVVEPLSITASSDKLTYAIYTLDAGALRVLLDADWTANPTAFVFQVSY